MSGFPIVSGDRVIRHHVVWVSHAEIDGNPLFVLIHEDGIVAVHTPEYLAEYAAEVLAGDRQWDDVYEALYLKLPDHNSLIRVDAETRKDQEGQKLVVLASRNRTVLYSLPMD